MKLFGSLSELVAAVFRKNSQAITLRPNQTTTYTSARDVQLPQVDFDEVMVGRVSADTGSNRLKNKDLEDTTVVIVDTSDTTKKIKFDAAGTTGTSTTIQGSQTTNQVWTLPDATDTAVGKATTDTLTNKTLTSPAINTPNLDGGTASATSRVIVSKETTTNLNALTRKQAAIYYDTTTNEVKFDNGSALSALSTSSTASPTAAGSVTSYFPLIQSAVLSSSSATINLTTTDGYEVVLCTANATTQTVNLPAASSNTGRILTIKKTGTISTIDGTGAGRVIIDPNSSETIEGGTTTFINLQNAYLTIACDGTSWYIVASGGDYITAVQNHSAATSNGNGTYQLLSISVPAGRWKIGGAMGRILTSGGFSSTYYDWRSEISATSASVDASVDTRGQTQILHTVIPANMTADNGRGELTMQHQFYPWLFTAATTTIYLNYTRTMNNGETYTEYGHILAYRA